MNGYQNAALCKRCKGDCCKRAPGAAFPSDFPRLGRQTAIKAALLSGRWVIDWWEGEPLIYFLRPATTGAQDRIFHASWGGRGVFLRPTGCELAFSRRPRGCRVLEPIRHKGKIECISHHGTRMNDKHASALAWKSCKGINLEKIGKQVEAERKGASQ